jgi:antitoxin component YwqK of YwqJK toxin-antitoxin module
MNLFSAFLKTSALLVSITTVASLVHAQNPRESFLYYQNGMVAERDSLFEGDSISLHESYYGNTVAYINDTLWEGDSIAPRLMSRGLLRIDGQMRRSIGTWRHWYPDGQLDKEYFHHATGPSRLVSAYTTSGEPLIREGVGVLREVYPGSFYGDSVEYRISDSLHQGQFIGWRAESGGNKPWIRSRGTCIRGVVVGTLVMYYPSGAIERTMTEPNGIWQAYYSNGVLKSLGDYQNHDKEGSWLYWDSIGTQMKEETYDSGRLHGPYKEYHSNGRLRVSGQYEYTSGIDTVYMESLSTGDLSTELVQSSTIPAKHGRWLFFTDNGDLLREEEYVFGVLQR